MAENASLPQKRGPAPKLQQQTERIQRSPRTHQRFVMHVIDTVLNSERTIAVNIEIMRAFYSVGSRGHCGDAGALNADADQHRVRTTVDYHVVNSLRGKTERIEKLCGCGSGYAV